MLQSKKLILFCLFMVLGLVACQKEVLVDSDTNFVGQELSKLSNIPAPEFTITTYDTSPGNINTNVSCTFNVLCDGLASGAGSFSTTLNSAGQYSAFGFVGETYVNNPIWFNHAQTYLYSYQQVLFLKTACISPIIVTTCLLICRALPIISIKENG